MTFVYPIPRQLTTSPYLDQLYAPFAAWPEWTLRRIPFAAAVRELIQEGQQGFLFTPGDQESLHAALARAATHPDLGALGERAYQAALPFDWPSIAAKTAALYQQVLAAS